eukprot:gnl/Hemi2/12299_TR4206_c0_g1_i1.p1 gnl/Hemi2/12299_TR4206_c0_g1~~gnl/Hemi2/12299_TR4206_c0_g1_i1.p1  ORF type:complete len:403 (+),score=112.01 gnl/Hemi2/12299_TR4206_c0_g1_i1:57-1265(+)
MRRVALEIPQSRKAVKAKLLSEELASSEPPPPPPPQQDPTPPPSPPQKQKKVRTTLRPNKPKTKPFLGGIPNPAPGSSLRPKPPQSQPEEELLPASSPPRFTRSQLQQQQLQQQQLRNEEFHKGLQAHIYAQELARQAWCDLLVEREREKEKEKESRVAAKPDDDPPGAMGLPRSLATAIRRTIHANADPLAEYLLDLLLEDSVEVLDEIERAEQLDLQGNKHHAAQNDIEKIDDREYHIRRDWGLGQWQETRPTAANTPLHTNTTTNNSNYYNDNGSQQPAEAGLVCINISKIPQPIPKPEISAPTLASTKALAPVPVKPKCMMTPEDIEKITVYQNRYEKFCARKNATMRRAGFDQWNLQDFLANELLEDVLQDVTTEFGSVCDNYVERLFQQELTVNPA